MRALPLLLLLLACDNPRTVVSGGNVMMDSSVVVVNGDTPADRAKAAWAEAATVTMSEGTVDIFGKVGTKVAVDNADRVRGVPEANGTVSLSDPSLADVVFGTDESKLADKLRDAGAKVIVVHSALRHSFDRSSAVLSRLYHHDELSRFQLIRVESGYLVYLINDRPLRFDAQVADAATRWLRDQLTGKNPKPFPPLPPDRGSWTLMTTLRGGGQEVAFSLAEGATLDRALIETAVDLEAYHRRNKEILGMPKLATHMDSLVIEVRRVRERALVVPRDEAELEDLWEMGLDGAILLDKEGSKKQSGSWPGSVAMGRGILTADQFLRGVARDFKWDSLRPWRDSDQVTLELVRTLDYREVTGSMPVPSYRGTTMLPLEAVNIDLVKSSIVYSGEWYLANLTPDGMVTYKFWPEENRFSQDYNHVRHELATWNLWQAWTLDPRPEFLEGAIRAQDWTLRALVERDATNFEPWERKLIDESPLKDEIMKEGMAYFTFGNNTKLGSVVVALYGMIEVARATNDHSKDELMRKLGRYVMFAQTPDGKFRPYHVPPGHPYEFEKNDIVPGEAALALVYLYEYFNDPQYLAPLDKFFTYYKPWFDERAVKRNTRAPWPRFLYDNQTRLDLVQFGPWTVMAANAFTRNRPERTDVSDFGLEVARWMVESYGYTADRVPFPDYLGGYYKFEGELPAMQAFCYGEGTAAAYDMALRQKPSEAAYFERATRETVRFGIQMQHDALDTHFYARPELVQGGTRYAMNDPKVRIDYTYHMQSTLVQWLNAAVRDPNLAPTAKGPSSPEAALIFKLQDMPFYRDPGAPARTSVPRAEVTAPVTPPPPVTVGTEKADADDAAE